MRTNSDPEKDNALLGAVLGDENWLAANSAFKAHALTTFRVRQRIRRATRWTAGLAVLVAAAALTAHWLHGPETARPKVMIASAAHPKPLPGPRPLSDAELIACFPKGSCFIAEVDGKKQLVFADPKVEQACVAR
jgi:hypothetical protein